VNKDLWSSGVHVKETRGTLTRGLHKPPHGGGGNVSSTVARIKENKEKINILNFGEVLKQPISNYATVEHIHNEKELRTRRCYLPCWTQRVFSGQERT
jgi:hypothetical protein